MAYVITKQPDGDVSLGNLNGEFVTLTDSISDYATGGYPIVSGETANTNNTPNLINCDLWRVLMVIPQSGQGGYTPVWNLATQKLQIYQNGAVNSPGVEVPNQTDFSAYSFNLLLVGY